MVDLDSNPTKLIEIVEIGKQLLMTRGALTTFSIANDVAKYFAIIPAAFATTYPQLNALNVMGLASPASAILSAVIFNALIIVALIPLALKGVRYRPVGAAVRAAQQHPDLRRGRDHRAVHRHQADRPDSGCGGHGLISNCSKEKSMLTDIRRAVTMLAVMTLITGLVYPLVVTGISSAAFPGKARGSLIEREGKAVGSVLIGQPFSDPKHFWSRPSATGPVPYNAGASSGSNQGPLNPALYDAVAARVKALRDADPDKHGAGAGRSGDRLRQRARSAHQPGGGRLPGQSRVARVREPSHPRRSARWSRTPRKAGNSVSSANRGSMCSSSTSRSMRDSNEHTAGVAGKGSLQR